jgi:multidrug transporter EmrE-like cation transporter
MDYTYLLIALVLNATANILLKTAAMSSHGTSIPALVTNPFALAGVFIFASNVYFYIQALKNLPLTLVYPVMTAVSFLIINTYGFAVLKEPWSLLSLLGYALIIAGIILVVTSFK